MYSDNYKLNPTAASLLGFLYEKPLTGWDIYEMAEERIGKFWSITKSQVYRELLLLAKEGYIRHEAKGSRMKQPYAITDAGKKAFKQWANTIDSSETIRIPMLLAVSFSRHMDKAVIKDLLQSNLSVHQKQQAVYEAILESLPKTAAAQDARRTLSFGVRYEAMTIDWIKETLESYEVG